MLLELLLCLNGHRSELFNSENAQNAINKYCSIGEKEIVERILKIGLKYAQIKEFINNYKKNLNKSPRQDYLPPGSYLRALCCGLEQGCEEYLRKIADLELQITETSYNLCLTLVVSTAESFMGKLEIMNTVIESVVKERLHGCQILDYLYKLLFTNTENEHFIFKLIKEMQGIFYNQLIRCLLYGDILDPHKEFFIHLRQNEENCSKEYYIEYKYLPAFLSQKTAKTILHVAQIVDTLLTGPVTKINTGKNDEFYNWKRNVESYAKEMYAMQNEIFDLNSLNRIISPHNKIVTEKLWNLAAEERKLLKNLFIVRKYLLLSQGDVFQEFIKLFKQHFEKKTSEISTVVLNQMFDSASCNVQHTEDCSDSLQIYYEQDYSDSRVKNEIRMKFTASWPLHIIFNENMIAVYGVLFNVLFRLKVAEMSMHNLWLQHTKLFKIGNHKTNQKLHKFRNKCSHLIENIQYYLQVIVIETNFCKMIQTIRESKNDFQIVTHAHEHFVQSILEQSCLFKLENSDFRHASTSTVLQIMLLLINQIEKFIKVRGACSNPVSEYEAVEIDKCNEIINNSLHCLINISETSQNKHLLSFINYLDLLLWLKI